MGKGFRRAWGMVDPVGAKLAGMQVSAKDEMLGGLVNPVSGLNGTLRRATNDRVDLTSAQSTMGAVTGAATGAMIGGPAGAAVGAVAGGLIGSVQHGAERENELQMLKAEQADEAAGLAAMSALEKGSGGGAAAQVEQKAPEPGIDVGLNAAGLAEASRLSTARRGSYVGGGSRSFGFTTQERLGG